MREFWAKTPRQEPPAWDNIHPVLDHLIDVSLVFDELTRGIWSGMGDYLTSFYMPATDHEKETARRALCVLAGLHDIGKVSPGFQFKVPELVPGLKEQGFPFYPADQRNHGVTSFNFLLRRFESLPGIDDDYIPLIYAQAAACHHGSYIECNPDFNNLDRWEQAREEHFQEVCRIWNIDPDAFPMPSTPPPAQWTVTPLMVPVQVTIIPEFLLMLKLRWTDTYLPLIIPSFLVGSFGTFMFKEFFENLPRALLDAGTVDGARALTIFARIYLPQSRSCIATLFIIAFMNNWNDLLRPILYISSENLQTVTMALTQFQSQYTAKWNLLLTGGVLSVIPLLVLYVILQKAVIEGSASSGIKG